MKPGADSVTVMLSLASMDTLNATIFDQLESADFVCIDDIDRIAGVRDLEIALFDLYNRSANVACRWLITGASAPRSLGIELDDLASRMSAALVYQLTELSDADKIDALIAHARRRGMELSERVATYMLSRLPRDFAALMAALDRIDEASLSEDRHLTVPFVRDTLDLG